MRAKAFTIVELLVVIAVIGVLLVLAAPALRSAKLASTELRCVALIRTHGTSVAAYTSSFRDRFPATVSDGAQTTTQKGRWRAYTLQSYTLLRSSMWRAFSGTGVKDPTTVCPANQHLRDVSLGPSPTSDYAFSDTLFIESAYLNPGIAPSIAKRSLGAKVQSASDVFFPSAKVALYENWVWHGWNKTPGPTTNFDDLSYFQSTRPGSVVMHDGSALLRRPSPMPWLDRYPIWGYTPYGMTPWGVRGLDSK